MTKSKDIKIVPFQSENQDAVKTLINQGLGEHWGTIDPTKNPDLDDIANTYQNDYFLVASLDGIVIGTGALRWGTSQVAEIARMSVAPHIRRQGVGNKILDQLIQEANRKGYKKIILETTETWCNVIAFYLAYGFQITHRRDGNIYFSLDLKSGVES
jgi:putative acetyltransferase